MLIKAGPVGNIVWPAGVQWLLEAFYFIKMYILQTYFGYRCINLYSVKKSLDRVPKLKYTNYIYTNPNPNLTLTLTPTLNLTHKFTVYI